MVDQDPEKAAKKEVDTKEETQSVSDAQGNILSEKCKEKQQKCPMKDCGRDHFKSSHGVFIKWRKEREEEREKSPSRYRDRSKSREREKPHKKTSTKEEKKESNTEPLTGKYKKDNKTKINIKMVEVTTDEETATETEDEERPSKPKLKKLRRVKERSVTPRPRSSYYREILTDEEDYSEDEPKRTRRVKATHIRMVKESRERSDEEYNFLVRETFDDRGVNHDVTATVDTGATTNSMWS